MSGVTFTEISFRSRFNRIRTCFSGDSCAPKASVTSRGVVTALSPTLTSTSPARIPAFSAAEFCATYRTRTPSLTPKYSASWERMPSQTIPRTALCQDRVGSGQSEGPIFGHCRRAERVLRSRHGSHGRRRWICPLCLGLVRPDHHIHGLAFARRAISPTAPSSRPAFPARDARVAQPFGPVGC